MFVCPDIEITWYPGEYPSTASPLVLLDEDHKVEGAGPLEAMAQQLVQRADYVRSGAPDFFARGNVTTALRWTEVRQIPVMADAITAGLAIVAGLPTTTGWLKIVVNGSDTTWKGVPATIRGVGQKYHGPKGLLYLDWSVDCGPLSILVEGEEPPVIWPDGEIELEEATPTDRVALLLEDAE